MAQVTIPTSTPNGIIVPKPDAPGVYSRYASGQSTVLGWVQVGAGSAVIIAGIIVLSTYKNNVVVGDLFSGILLLAAGTCGVLAGKYKTSAPIVAFMVLSIIASVVAVCAFFVWTVEVGEMDDKYRGTGHVAVAKATGYVFIFAYLIEAVVSVWSAVIACNVSCCGQRHPVIAIASTGYNRQHGNVTLMFTHSNQCSSPSSSNPPSYMQQGCVRQPPPPYYSGSQQQQPAYGMGEYGMQQSGYGMQQGPYGMQQGPYGMQQQGPFGQQQGPFGQQQGPSGRHAAFGAGDDFVPQPQKY